jgi:hypothetical protein
VLRGTASPRRSAPLSSLDDQVLCTSATGEAHGNLNLTLFATEGGCQACTKRGPQELSRGLAGPVHANV